MQLTEVEASLSKRSRPAKPPRFPYTTLSRSGVVDDDRRPRRAQILGDSGADSLRRSGDDGDSSFELEGNRRRKDRKSTRLNSSHGYITNAAFCMKKNSISTTAPQPSSPMGHL